MITKLIEIKNINTPLYIPSYNEAINRQWAVCALFEDCGCLDIFDSKDYIEKSLDYFNKSKYFTTAFFAFDLDDIVVNKIINTRQTKEVHQKIEQSINASNYDNYYESFAITNNSEDFLILHSHADDVTFLCGTKEFLKYQLNTNSISSYMYNYHNCIKKFADFCNPFPWERIGIKDENFY